MNKTICGIDCGECPFKNSCGGCAATNGSPFGGKCVLAGCCQGKGQGSCGECSDSPCGLKEQLIAEFNALGIEDMPRVTDLNALLGSFINLEYTLENGQKVKLWDDKRVYLGNQLQKENSDRCYGLTADENRLAVCEYGVGGTDAVLIAYMKRRNQSI